MPKTQSAQVAVYDFGAVPTAGAPGDVVLKFSCRFGGKLDLRFENADGEQDITVAAEVSPDNSSYSATTAAVNNAAVTAEVIKRKTSRAFEINMRAGVDKFLRIRASGSARGQLQIREIGSTGLDIVQI